MGQDTLFTSLDFGQGVYHTRMPGKTPGPGKVYSSLIIGEKKALVIDTGFGIGDYEGYLRTLTDLPLIVANTHGHIDHAGGNGQFGQVWLNPLDNQLAEECKPVEARLHENWVEGYENLLQGGEYELLPLKEGMVFDLGGRTVSVHKCVGHTRGSMSFLDSRTKYLFTGDNITRRVLLIGPYKSSTGTGTLPEFRQTIKETKKLDFDHIVAAHVPYLLDPSWLDRVEAVVENFRPEEGKPPISFGLTAPGSRFLEFTVGRDFDDPEYCGFVFDANHLDEFLGK